MKKLLTTRDVASLCEISCPRVRQLVYAGRIAPVHKDTRYLLFRESDAKRLRRELQKDSRSNLSGGF